MCNLPIFTVMPEHFGRKDIKTRVYIRLQENCGLLPRCSLLILRKIFGQTNYATVDAIRETHWSLILNASLLWGWTKPWLTYPCYTTLLLDIKDQWNMNVTPPKKYQIRDFLVHFLATLDGNILVCMTTRKKNKACSTAGFNSY